MLMRRSIVSRCLPLLALAVLSVAGCGEGSRGTVKGTVTYHNVPVTGYILNLIWKEKGIAVSVPVSDDGSFALTDRIEPGTYTAYLSPKPPEPQPPGMPPPKKTAVGKIPSKYTDVARSDLTITLKGGVNEAPLELKD